ncbi:MAG: hypothetical protein J6C96_11490 [Oscillospiraceae bacterium]|nr:hypothetical protein [Oscillospiraceae bacterium]
MKMKKQYAFLNKIARREGIVLWGSTTLDELPVSELLQRYDVSSSIYNRSISGLTIAEAESCLDMCVYGLHPGKVVINLGEEDLKVTDNVEKLIEQYRWILYKIHIAIPDCRIILTSVRGHGEAYDRFNEELKRLAIEFGCTFYNIPEVSGDEEYGTAFLDAIKLSLYDDSLNYTDIAAKAVFSCMAH